MGDVCIPRQVPETDICQFFMRVEGEVWGEETIRVVLLQLVVVRIYWLGNV